jgi:hypothetical protein
VDIARADCWPCPTPTIQFNDDGSLSRRSWSKLAGQEVAEPYVVRRDDELSLVLRSAKQVDETEKIDVVQTLERIIKNGGIERRTRYAQVERQERADGKGVHLGTGKNRRWRVAFHF